MDTAYLPEQSFYSGNGRLISGTALQGLAEYLGNYRCTNCTRCAFVEILNGLEMPDKDRRYYQLAAGVEQ